MSDYESGDESGPLTPKVIEYCPHCTFPPEYCEFSAKWDQCQVYLKDKHPELYEKFSAIKAASKPPKKEKAPEGEEGDEDEDDEDGSGDDADDKKPVAPPVFKMAAKKEIIFTVKSRNRRKHVTYVQGVENFGFIPKDLAKQFAKKFATASTVSDEGIQLQGDLCFDIADFLQQLNPDISNGQFILMKPGNIRSKLFPF